jgi:hypothetical protein
VDLPDGGRGVQLRADQPQDSNGCLNIFSYEWN